MPYDGPQPIPGMYVLAGKPMVACDAINAAHNRRERNSRDAYENAETLGDIDRRRYGVEGGKTNRYSSVRKSIRGGIRSHMMPRRPSYNPSRYYGGNSETKEDLEKSKLPVNPPVQAGGKRKKSKKSRRSVDYGSMMLYGGSKKI
jgi:hypothetical protein